MTTTNNNSLPTDTIVAPVKAAVKKTTKKQVSKPVPVAAPIAPVVVETVPVKIEEPKVETPVVEAQAPTADDLFKSLFELQLQKTKLEREINEKTKVLSKMYQKDIKEAQKTKKRKIPSDPENPKGITKPVLISDKLANFLGVPSGSKMSRPEVTKRTSAYLTEKGLKHPENRSIFDIDANLKAVIGEPIHLLSRKNPELGHGYCNSNLQTYLSPHFLKEQQ